VPGIVAHLDEVYRTGRDPRSIIESLVMRLAELTRAAYGIEVGSLRDAAVEAGLTSTASLLGKDRILAFRSELAIAHREVRDVSLPRVWVEAELVRIALHDTTGSPQPAVKAPAAEPSKPPTPPTGDTEFDKLASAWHKVVLELAGVSKVAAARLPKSKLVEVQGKTARVSFERQSDAEWVTDSAKVQRAIYDVWNKNGGQGFQLRFEAQRTNGARPQTPETTTVELPAEGETLERLGREVFGQSVSE
jgi:DNA polymerase III gamma/tau subunit